MRVVTLFCPNCSTELTAGRVNLNTGWARCGGCRALFHLANVIPDWTNQQSHLIDLARRPQDARTAAERTDNTLRVHVPAVGTRVETWAGLGFMTCWFGFVGYWTVINLGGPFPLCAAFSVPFWIVGAGLLGGILWEAAASRTAKFTPAGLEMSVRSLGWVRCWRFPRERVWCARAFPSGRDAKKRRSGWWVEIPAGETSFRLQTDSEDEQRWLVAEINDFLDATAG